MLDTKNDADPSSAYQWLDAETARRRLKDHISGFMQDQASWSFKNRGGPPPALGLRVSAGLGKTRTALECLAEQADIYLQHGHILFFVPTLDLAVEAEADFRKLGSRHPSLVLRGRTALNPDTNLPMCARSALVEKITKRVRSITKALCRGENSAGQIVYAPCARGCSYLAQGDGQANQIIFLAHSYLKLNVPVRGDVALRIVDEKFWSNLVELGEISLEELFLAPAHMERGDLADIYRTASHAIACALEKGSSVHASLQAGGIGGRRFALLRNCSKAGHKLVKPLTLHSHMIVQGICGKHSDSLKSGRFP